MKKLRNRLSLSDISFGVLFLLAFFTPASTWALTFIPAPLVFLFMQGKWRRALSLVLIGLMVTAMFGVWVTPLLALSALTGAAYLVAKGLKGASSGIATVNATLVIAGLFIVIFGLLKLSGVPPWPLVAAQVHSAVRQALPIMGTPKSQWSSLQSAVVSRISLDLPAIIIIISAVMVLANVSIVRLILTRKHSEIAPVMSQISLPKSVVILFAATFLLSQLSSHEMNYLLWQFINNTLIISTFLLLLQALSLIWWFLRRRRFGLFLWLCASGLSLFSVLGYLYVILGLLDIVLNFRKVHHT